ncbi:MAG: adenine deaminase [bacterium]
MTIADRFDRLREMNSLKENIAVARGEKKADLVLKNGQLINVFSGEIYSADVAINHDRIVGIGSYEGEQEIDLNGKYITPGFIDSHLHMESTLLHPAELAQTIVPYGTTTIIADPHEIANVLGVAGIKYMIEATKNLPLDVFFTVPSCVPATDFETSGARLGVTDVTTLLKKDRVIRLGEMINFPGVISGNKDILAKLEAACRLGVEGHAPGLKGKELNAYVAAGISSDHETVTLEEAKEKLRLGMEILVREGSSAKNMEAIIPLINAVNSQSFAFCTDDIFPADLVHGHINRLIKKAVALKVDPIIALQMATINPARFYNLIGYGAVAPGYFADINVISNLEDFDVDMVFKKGKLVSAHNKMQIKIVTKKKAGVRETMNIKPFEIEALAIKAESGYAKCIEVVADQNLTKSIVVTVKEKDGLAIADPSNDLLKLAVVERHKASGNIGLGFVKGFGLQRGAIATSLAHDSHNIVCAGVDDEDMISAIRRVAQLGGGMVAVKGGLVLAELPLPIAGIISDLPLAELLVKQKKLDQVIVDLGCPLPEPFGSLSFLALPLIPELRLTDQGLIDVEKFKLVPLFE